MMTIGITESDTNFQYYAPWVKGDSKGIEVIILSYKTQNYDDLKRCDGLVLSGGVDVHPRFYNNQRFDYPKATLFNEIRDEFEINIFNQARVLEMPILAICRGMQIANIALGGTLIQDLEEHGLKDHRKRPENDHIHDVHIVPDCLLKAIVHTDQGIVNSAHHQALGIIADPLTISARSEDQVIEAIEYKDPVQNPFFLGVQWHPERLYLLQDHQHFSQDIRSAFLLSIGQRKRLQ